MKIEKAIYNWFLEDSGLKIITKETLFLKFLELWKSSSYKKRKLSNVSYRHNFNYSFDQVQQYFENSSKVFLKCKAHGGYVYAINTSSKLTPEDTVLSIYPIGYLNYISALQKYNLTAHQSKKIYFTTIPRQDWNSLFFNLLEKIDFSYLPKRYTLDIKKLKPIYPKEEMFHYKKLIVLQQKALDNFIELEGYRLNEIGSLFIDITRRPDLSGGYSNVIECYKNFAKTYLNEIYRAIEIKGTNIDKARVGYLLDKLVGIKDANINQWKREMVGLRGSSRKLASSKPFESKFDPEWNISLNM